MSDRSVIDDYWEDPNTVSLVDKNLRKLETEFVLAHLNLEDEFADLGCGDGESTVEYAKKVRTCVALERSNHLRGIAKSRFEVEKLSNTELVEGDVSDLREYEGSFNTVLTQRVVINFMTWAEQKEVISNIWKTLRPGGRYIMLENTFEGFEALNGVRRDVGLPNIKLHDWHNYFLHLDEFEEFIEGKFVIEKVQTFNLYYLLTRVFTNMFANFEGYGAKVKKDPIFESADAAAFELFKTFGSRVSIDLPKGESFGPIQGFVLRRMG